MNPWIKAARKRARHGCPLAELCQILHSLHVERRPNDFPLEPPVLREGF